jgi:excisionase family DNA binding protein
MARIQLVSIRDAARQLGISPDTIRKWIGRGLPCVRLERRVLLDQQLVERISRQGMCPGAIVDPGKLGY